MDFDGAIKAHAEWKMKLTTYIKKPDGTLKADVVCQDDQCALGKWLYGEGAGHSSIPEFGELKSTHALFHKAAADLIRKADAGTKVDGEVALGANSDYAKISSKVTLLIMTMKSKASKYPALRSFAWLDSPG